MLLGRRLAEGVGPLRHGQYRYLFAAQVASVIGDYTFTVALAFAVLGLTHSPRYLGLVFSAQIVPLVIFILAGGVWADRGRRERLMIGADVVRCSSQALLAGLLVSGTAQLWELFALQLVNGTATAIFRPAASGLLPQTVPADDIQPANALFTMATAASTIVGPALGGVLVAALGPGWATGLDALSFAVSAALLSRLHIPAGERPPRQAFLREMAEGWTEVRSRTWILASMLEFAAFQLVVLGTIFVLGPVVAERSLGGAAAWGAFLAAFGAGAFGGGLTALRVRPRRPLATIFVLIMGAAPALVLLALAVPVPAIAAGFFLAGAMSAFGDTVWVSTLQSKVPEHVLSRVTAYDWLGSTVLFPIGLSVAGPVAAAIGPAPTLFAAAAILVASSLAVLAVPAVRRLTADPLGAS